MKRMLLFVLVLMFAFTNITCTASMDISAMTDDALKALSKQIESELARRQTERNKTIVTEDDGEIIYVNDGEHVPEIIFSSYDQLKSRLHKIELTPENWDQYLGDYYYAYELVSTNNFGEVTSRYDRRAVGFGFKEGYIGCMRDVGVKFSGSKRYTMGEKWIEEENHYAFTQDYWREENEVFTADVGTPGLNNVHLEDYEFLAITGYIFVLEVSPEMTQWVWQHSNNSNNYIKIKVGDRDFGASHSLWVPYEELNP